MLASMKGHVEIVEMLLSYGAKVDLLNKVILGGVWGDGRHSGT